MAKCTNCNGTGIVGEGRLGRICGRCKGIGFVDEPRPKKKEPTNEEWLWSATTEQLVGTIYEWYTLGYIRGKNGKKLNSITEVVEWLKEEHNDSM